MLIKCYGWLHEQCDTVDSTQQVEGLAELNINGRVINTLRNDDDVVFLAENEELQDLVDRVNRIRAESGLDITINKTKTRTIDNEKEKAITNTKSLNKFYNK